MTAASVLLDRGYGKSLSQKDISVNVTGGDSFVEALREINKRPKVKLVDGNTVEDVFDQSERK